MQEPIYCKYCDDVVYPYCAYLKRTHHLNCDGSGGGFMDNINNIHLSFSGVKNLSIDEARILIIESSEELLNRINNDIKVRPYLSHYPFTEKGISLLISLDKKNGDRVDSDFIAFVFTSNGMVYYDVYDSQENLLKKVYEEPYKKALQIVNQTKFLKKPSIATQKEEVVEEKTPSKLKIICQRLKEKFKKIE